MSKSRSVWQLWLLAIVVFGAAMMPASASASHFRGGSITWQAAELDADGQRNDVVVTVKTAWGSVDSPISLTSPQGLSFTQTDEVYDYINGTYFNDAEYTLKTTTFEARDLDPEVQYSVFYSSSARIGNLRNNANGRWNIQSTIYLKDGNQAPKIDLPILFEVPKLQQDGVSPLTDFTFSVAATDPNADSIRFRLANLDELGGNTSTNPDGMSIDTNTGLVTWQGSGSRTSGLYSAGIVVEDVGSDGSIKSKSHVDIILDLQDKSATPFTPGDTIPESRNVIVEKGDTFEFEITGTAVDVSSLGNVSGALSETSEGQFEFSPGPVGSGLAAGTYPITFEIRALDGSTTKSYLILNFIVPDPRAPKIANIEADTTIYGGTGDVLVDVGTDSLVTDTDLNNVPVQNLDNGFLRFNVGFSDGQYEVLDIRSEGDGSGQIRRDGYEVFYEGVKFADIDPFENGVGRALRLDLTSATLDAVQTLVRSLTYRDTFVLRSSGQRNLSLFIEDADGLNRNYSLYVDVQDHPDKPAKSGPLPINNQLSLDDGETVSIGTEQLSFADADNTADQITLTISGLANGQFENTNNPGVGLTSFTQELVNQGRIQFVHDGSGLAPSFQVSASDGTNSEGPFAAAISFSGTSSESVSLFENRIGVQMVSAGNVTGTPTFAITGGADSGLFSVNPGSGSLAFNASPDYENPSDSNQDNVYDVEVTVTGATSGTDVRTVDVTIMDVNEAPEISGVPGQSVTVPDSYSFTPGVVDPENGTVTFSIENKPSWASFDSQTGELSGTPTASDAGVVSNIEISATDGASTDSLPAFGLTVDLSTYSVEFRDFDSSVIKSETVEYGSGATAPADPSRTGYTFTGWNTGFDSVTSDLTVTAQYTVNSYTVTFQDYDGSVLKTESVDYGSGAAAPTAPSRTGYTFNGWSVGFGNITADLTVAAQYTINSYTVTFQDHDGSVLKTESVNYGNGATAPTAPSRTGYTFNGWSTGFGNVTSDLAVSAQYTINSYTVTFQDYDSSVLKTESVNYGSGATAPTAPSRTGYTFDGWSVGFGNITADLTVAAQYTINSYTVAFQDHDGSVLKTESVNYGNGATAPTAPSRTGYTFNGWSTGFGNVTSDLSVSAQYTINSYTVTFQDYDGSVLKTESVNYGSGASAPAAPSRKGYQFNGWNGSFDNVSSELTIVAQYSIDFSVDTDGDGVPDAIEEQQGSNPNDPDDFLDTDGDGVSDYAEEKLGMDPNSDDVAPLVMAPSEMTVNATGLFTEVSLDDLTASGEPRADDVLDGLDCCVVTPDGAEGDGYMLEPGRHEIVWSASDEAGNVGTDIQVVNVVPTVSLSPDQVLPAEGHGRIRVLLNGNAPNYPVTVPYTVAGTAAPGVDHDLTDGEVTIESGTEASIDFNLSANSLRGDLELVVRLDETVNLGTHPEHVTRIVDRNIAPSVALTPSQAGETTMVVTPVDGPVMVTADIIDPNPADEVETLWDLGGLVDMDDNASTVTLDEGTLVPGTVQTIAVAVADNGQPRKVRSGFVHLKVVENRPILSSDLDTDDDGVSDSDEGMGDAQGNGIPDYLDRSNDRCSALPQVLEDQKSFMLESSPGTCLTLGQYSLFAFGGAAMLDQQEDISAGLTGLRADGEVRNTGGVFDFVVTNLGEPGQSADIVIPQRNGLPASALYRKFSESAGWRDFVVDQRNRLTSAPGEPGFCPPAGSPEYSNGLSEGDWCVQVTIEDGGPNDDDGDANGVIVDPSGAGTLDVTAGGGKTETKGGGGAGGPAFIALLILGLLVKLKQARGALLALVIGVPVLFWTGTTSADDRFPLYLNADLGWAKSSIDDSRIEDDLADLGSRAAVIDSDDDRFAWSIGTGIRFTEHWAAEISYIDLGDVSIELDTVVGSREMAKAHPESGRGPAAAIEYRHSIGHEFDLSAKAGVFAWSGDYKTRIGANTVSVDDQDSGKDLYYGLGISWQASRLLEVRSEVQRFEFDHHPTHRISVGVSFWLDEWIESRR